MKLKRYEYSINNDNGRGTYVGSYTIKENVQPLGYKNEKLVQEFEINYQK